MKKMTTLLCLSFLGGTIYAQQPASTKTGTKVGKGPVATIKMATKAGTGQRLIRTAVKDNYLVVVEDRIFENDREAFAFVPKDSLQLVESVRDSLSRSAIKSIRIYKRK